MSNATTPPDPELKRRAAELKRRAAALRDDPTMPEGPEILKHLCEAGRAKQALPLARAALEARPEDRALQRAMARVLLGVGDLQGAQSVLLALLQQDKQDAEAMVILADVLLQKADAQRARTMLMHAARLLGEEHPEVARLRTRLGEVTGEVKHLGAAGATAGGEPGAQRAAGRRKPPGPLIGGTGAILNVEDDDVSELQAPERLVRISRPPAGPAARLAWVVLALVVLGAAGVTYWRMHATAERVQQAVAAARSACRQGSLAVYRRAHEKLEAALRVDPASPDLRAWLALVEARMALEYQTGTSEVPATLSRAEKAQRQLRRHRPGWFDRLQVWAGLSYRGPHSGAAAVAEAGAILRVLQGVQPGPTAEAARGRALAELDAAVARYPEAVGLRYVRGLAHLAAGHPDKARTEFDAVVAQDEKHVPAQLALAGLLLERGHVVEAQERYNRVLGVSPGNLRARLGLVLTRLVRGIELAQAERALGAISPREGTPRLIRSWYALSQAWLAFVRGKLRAAREQVRHLGRALLAEPQWLAWYIRLALMLGDVGRARRPLVKGLAALRSGKDLLVEAFRLEVALLEGAADKVVRRVQALRSRLRPGEVAAKRVALVYGRALMAQGKWKRAARVFRALGQAKPEFWDRPVVAVYGAYARFRAALPALGAPPPVGSAGQSAQVAAVEAVLRRYDKGFSRPMVAYVRAWLHAGTDAELGYLEQARRDHRDAAPATVRLAERVLAAGDLPRARRLLGAAFALAPAYYPALRVRARLRYATGRTEDALADLTALCYANVQIRLPEGLLARIRWTGRWGGRLARFDRTTLCPSPLARPEDLYLRARLYLEQQSPSLLPLARLYTALGEAAGGARYRARLLRARIALSSRLTAKAAGSIVKALQALAKQDPAARADPRTWETLAVAKQATGDAKAARKTLARLVARWPHRLGAWLALAWVERSLGAQAAAVAAFRKALAEAQRRQSDPVAVQAQVQLALGRALMMQGPAQDLTAAQRAFEAAARLDPQLFQALVDQARLALRLHKPARARKHLEEVLRYDAGHPEALILLGRLLRKGKEADRKRIPGLLDRLVRSAEVEAKQGRPDAARDYLERALRLVAPGHPVLSLALGALLVRDPGTRARGQKLLRQVLAAGSPAQKRRAQALLSGRPAPRAGAPAPVPQPRATVPRPRGK